MESPLPTSLASTSMAEGRDQMNDGRKREPSLGRSPEPASQGRGRPRVVREFLESASPDKGSFAADGLLELRNPKSNSMGRGSGKRVQTHSDRRPEPSTSRRSRLSNGVQWQPNLS